MKTIALTDGFKFQIDDIDLEYVLERTWWRSGSGRSYIYQTGDVSHSRERPLSFQIAKRIGITSPGHYLTRHQGQLVIDHINRDSRINIRANLRSATVTQNSANTCRKPGRHGIGVVKSHGKFYCQITTFGLRVFSGPYLTAAEAESVYWQKYGEAHGEFACLVRWPEVFPELPAADYCVAKSPLILKSRVAEF